MPGLAHRRRPIDLGNPHPRTRQHPRRHPPRRHRRNRTRIHLPRRHLPQHRRRPPRRHRPIHPRPHRDHRRRRSHRIRRPTRCPTGRALRLVNGCLDRPPSRRPASARGLDRWSRARLTSPRLDRSHQDELHPQRAPRNSRLPRHPEAHHPAVHSPRRPTWPHSAPILRLDRQSRRPQHAHTDPARDARRVCVDPALTGTPRRPPRPRRAGHLRRRPHALLEHRPRQMASHRHLVARGSHLALTARGEVPLGTHLVRPRPEKPDSSRTSAGIIESVGPPGP